MKLKFKKWTEKEFFDIRKEVLKEWSTGKQVDLFEAVKYHKSLPETKNFSKKLLYAKTNKITLTQPRAGVASIDEHIELLNFLDREGEADLLSTTIDSYTRQNKYDQCQKFMEEEIKTKRVLLNGFPGVNHGVKGCRKVVENTNLPLQIKHGTPDARLLSEIMFAAGFTSNEGGGISYNVPFVKNTSIEKTLMYWQYVDRLVGWYEEHGVSLNREPFAPLTGTLVPPSMSNSVAILEGLMALEQGVKNITLGYGQCGNLVQDIAAIKALEKQATQYFKQFGYEDFVLTTVLHQWMGGLPEDEAKAYAIISNGAMTAALAGATKVIVKPLDESSGSSTKEANAAALKTTKMLANLLKEQASTVAGELKKEMDIIEAETKCILDKVYELGEGDWAIGIVRGFQQGVLDVPFAPSIYNSGKMMPARDNVGKVRYLEVGDIPFTEELINFNRSQLEERAKFEGRNISFQMMADDIFAIGKGNLIGRPKQK